MVVLNLGGEGEVTGAVNVNLLVAPTRRPPYPSLVQADATLALPFRDGCADRVIANRFPIFTGLTNVDQLALESLRVLKAGGDVAIMRSSGPAGEVAYALAMAGFTAVSLNGQVATGRAP